MNEDRQRVLMETYRDGLLDDVMPFWTRHAIDREHGGYLCSLGRDGSIVDTDKSVWQHGRFAWMLATLYNRFEQRAEWLELTRHGLEFLFQHGFDDEGNLYFHLDRTGQPIRKRRYVFGEAFAAIAAAAYGRATADEKWFDQARRLFDTVWLRYTGVTQGEPKFEATRPMKSIGLPMILINVMQELRLNLVDDEDQWSRKIDVCIDEIKRDFVHDALGCVLENVQLDGSFSDHFDGRILNPGHAIECAWFILNEADYRNRDSELTQLGCKMLDCMWERGWDKEFGGLFYFRDAKNLPVQEYWHDMKFWWPQCEGIIATLMAWQLTGDLRYAQWHEQLHDYAYQTFPDQTHGEWFGYFHRDGRRSVSLKGNMWKGPFHIPRMQWQCWQRLQNG